VKSPTSKGAPAPNSPSAPPHRRLRRTDLPLETVALARFLIGKLLIRQLDGGPVLAGRIVETEAYTPGDPASHAFRGPSERNRSMFSGPGHAYVYFIYGTSHCLNVSSEAAGVGAAVLLRALEPLAGAGRMRELRGSADLRADALARGPGNLCRALAVGRDLDGLDLDADPRLLLGDDGCVPEIGTSVRIGITRAAGLPLRFYLRGSRAVSGPRSLSP
jgi:DNA-3-methyladenine glycosylase